MLSSSHSCPQATGASLRALFIASGPRYKERARALARLSLDGSEEEPSQGGFYIHSMPALERSIRRKIFYAMAALFFVVAPAVLLYSRGYLVDFEGRSLVSTGGVFVKTIQPGTRVLLNGVFERETSFISRGALITNLLPKRYALRVEKEGRRPWEKVVRVASQEVLEFRNVFLPPATITPAVVFDARRSPLRVSPLPGRPEFLLEIGESGKPFTLAIVNPETRRARLNLLRVSTWEWDERTRTLIFSRDEGGRQRWFRVTFAADGTVSGEQPIRFRGLPDGFSADRVTPHPQNPGEFYFFAGGALFLQGRAPVPTPIADDVHAYAVARERLYFISKNGFFVESNLEGQETRILGRKGLFLDAAEPANIFAVPNGDVLVLDSAGGLFHFEPGRDVELSFVVGSVRGLDWSAAGERALLWDSHRLSIYWLRENRAQPFDLARSRKQIFFTDEEIGRAFLDAAGTYAFFVTPSGVRMTEVDDRGSTNTYELVRSPLASFLLDKENLRLYWTEDTKVWQADLK